MNYELSRFTISIILFFDDKELEATFKVLKYSAPSGQILEFPQKNQKDYPKIFVPNLVGLHEFEPPLLRDPLCKN